MVGPVLCLAACSSAAFFEETSVRDSVEVEAEVVVETGAIEQGANCEYMSRVSCQGFGIC